MGVQSSAIFDQWRGDSPATPQYRKLWRPEGRAFPKTIQNGLINIFTRQWGDAQRLVGGCLSECSIKFCYLYSDNKFPIQANIKGYMITNNNIRSSLSYFQSFPVCQKMFCLSQNQIILISQHPLKQKQMVFIEQEVLSYVLSILCNLSIYLEGGSSTPIIS